MLIYFHTRLSVLVRTFLATIVILGVLALQFFGSANGREFVRHFGGLQKHYLEHQIENPDTTLASFLSLHFGDLQKEHQSEHDHSGLPFQDGPHHDVVISGFVWMAPRMVSALTKPAIEYYPSVNTTDRAWAFPELTCDIWQPPRQV